MNTREINRRTLLVLAGAGVLGSRLHAAQSQLRRIRNGYATAPQFFAPGDYQLIETLTEMIIPTDDHSPGARKAGVPAYIDLVIANSSGEVRANWDHGLRAFDSAVQRYAGARFLVAAPDARAAALARIIDQRNEGDGPARTFLMRVREMTIAGYYSSEIGLLKELEYKGNQVMGMFPGCEH